MHDLQIARRAFLRGSVALAATSFLNGPIIGAAQAKAPMANSQAPAFYRFKIGTAQATVISDGPIISLGAPSQTFLGAPEAQVDKLLTDNFLDPDLIVLQQNALVLNTGERLVLFDTGVGAATMFGPDAGRLAAMLQAAGIMPEHVDAIVLSHAHPDHCWGLMDGDGKPRFPKAQIYMTEADFEFWTDEAKLADDDIKVFIEGTRKSLLPNRERITFIEDGEEVLPGIQAMAAPGHTVGHTVYLITSGDETFCFAADLCHHYVLSVETPQLTFAYDTDPQQAVGSRLRILDMLATDRMPFLAYHFPWPGIGHVAKAGDAYRYVPAPMRMVL